MLQQHLHPQQSLPLSWQARRARQGHSHTVVTIAGWEQGTPALSLQEELCRTAMNCTRLGSAAARTAADTAYLPECTAGEARTCGRVVCQKPGACCHPLQHNLRTWAWDNFTVQRWLLRHEPWLCCDSRADMEEWGSRSIFSGCWKVCPVPSTQGVATANSHIHRGQHANVWFSGGMGLTWNGARG